MGPRLDLPQSRGYSPRMQNAKRSSKMTKAELIRRVSSSALPTDTVLTDLARELHDFEAKYHMRSEVFHALIVGTPAEDTPDFVNWAMCYRSYFRTLQAKFSLKTLASYAR